MRLLVGNLAHILCDAAARDPNALAVIDGDTSDTYAELAVAAGAIAGSLTDTGLQTGDRVGIFQQRGAIAAASFYAVLAAGGIAVNINETLRRRQVEHILQKAGVKYVLAHPDFVARTIGSIDESVRVIDPRLDAGAPCRPVARVAGDVAHIIYTSGSTGMPKGVAITHGNLWAGTESVASYLGLEADDRIASLLPFSFDYGLNQALGATLVGAALVVDRSPIPQRIVRTLATHDVTVLAAVPPLWLQLLAVDGFETMPLPRLRVLTNTGGRLPREAVRRIREAQPQAALYLMYGLTEAFRSTYLDPDLADTKPDSIGRAIPGAEITIVDDDGVAVGPGEVGQLVHRGPTVAPGYWDDPIATAERFRPPPMQDGGVPDSERAVFSGDLVRRDSDGDLYFVGRRDSMIKSRGFRLSPDEIVEVLFASGAVEEAIVFGEDDGVLGSRIAANVVLRPGSDVGHLWEFVRAELPPYMQPDRIDVVTELRRGPSGKYASPRVTAS